MKVYGYTTWFLGFVVLLSLGVCGDAAPCKEIVRHARDDALRNVRRSAESKLKARTDRPAVMNDVMKPLMRRFSRVVVPKLLSIRIDPPSATKSTFSPGIIAACVLFPTLLLLVPLTLCFYCGCCSCTKDRRDQRYAADGNDGSNSDASDGAVSTTSRKSKLDCRLSEVSPAERPRTLSHSSYAV
jgi:hypothetical protein